MELGFPSPERRRQGWGGRIAFGIWLLVTLPMLFGLTTFFFRDVFGWHFPLRAFGAAALRAGEIPAIHPGWAGGQAFRGNPNALAFYPGNLLYLVLPFLSAYNLHFCLHWLLSFFSMRTLARCLGQGRTAALLAALTYAGQGFALSALTFYGLIVVYAWWPLVLAGVWRGGRRGTAAAAIACGLAILGGEPVITGIGLGLLAFVVLLHPHRLCAAGRGAAVLLLGAAIGLPQIVATLRILPFTFRVTRGVLESQVVSYSLHPLRLLELLVPFPFGIPGYAGEVGLWAARITPLTPYVLSLYCGSVALALALVAVRRRRAWGALTVAGYLLAWLGGLSATVVIALTFGLFRFPEKLLFWPALGLPLLAGWGLETVASRAERWQRWTRATGLGLLVAAVAALPASLAVQGWLASQLRVWGICGSVAGLALWLAAGGEEGRRGARLVGMQLLSLTVLLPVLFLDLASPYREPPPWAERLGEGQGVFNPSLAYPPWPEQRGWQVETALPQPPMRAQAADLAPAPGVYHRLTYPLAPDIDGMHSPYVSLLLANLPRFSWPERIAWFRLLGVEALVLYDDPGIPELELLDEATRFGRRSRLYRVPDVAPVAWWPRRLAAAAHPVDALRRVGRFREPQHEALVPDHVSLEHDPDGTVRLLQTAADRVELEVRGEGGIVVVRRAYHPLYRATAGGRPLATLPVNLCLLGVVVPAGHQRVAIEVTAWPEITAGIVALAVVLLLALQLRRSSRGATRQHRGDAQ